MKAADLFTRSRRGNHGSIIGLALLSGLAGCGRRAPDAAVPEMTGPQPVTVSRYLVDVPVASRVRWQARLEGNILRVESVGDSIESDAFDLLAEDDIWALHFVDASGTSVAVATPSNGVFPRPPSLVRDPSTGVAVAAWFGTAPGIPNRSAFGVVVRIAEVPGDRVVELDISVTTNTPSLALDWVEFPRVQVASRGATASQRLSVPHFGGVLVSSPIVNPLLSQGPSSMPTNSSVSMQWFSYYDSAVQDGPVLFLGTRDGKGFRKEFHFDNTRGTLGWVIRCQPPNHTKRNGDYLSPFKAVIGVVRGDWYDAARYYRSWARGQEWMANGPMHRSPQYSGLIRDADSHGVIAATDSDFQFWSREERDFGALFGVGSVVGHVYGWHNNEFDVNWGNWFPVRPGYATHAPLIAQAGVAFAPYAHVGVYGAHSGVPSYTNSYVPGFVGESVVNYAEKNRDGSPNTLQDAKGNPAVRLCYAANRGALNFTGEYAKYLAQRLASETGARGIYLDVFSLEEPYLCYDPNHQHPLGGGDYQVQAKRALLEDLRATMRAIDPDYFVYSEAQNEMYVDKVELVYPHSTGEHSTPGLDLAPLYQTVYHDYQTVGRVAGVNGPPTRVPTSTVARVFRRIYAADIFMGYSPWLGSELSPTSIFVNMINLPEFAQFVITVKNFIAVLNQPETRRFVRFGPRLREPQTDAPLIPMQPGDTLNLPYRPEQPLVYASTWADSPNNPGNMSVSNAHQAYNSCDFTRMLCWVGTKVSALPIK